MCLTQFCTDVFQLGQPGMNILQDYFQFTARTAISELPESVWVLMGNEWDVPAKSCAWASCPKTF